MSLLITKDDFIPYKPLSTNITNDQIDPYINDAQVLDLQPFLGEPLYNEFINNLTETRFIDLLNGKNYIYNSNEIIYPGLKPLLVYFSYSRFIYNHDFSAVKFGIVQKLTDFSQPIDLKMLSMQREESRSIAISYQEKAYRFLYTELNTYPLFNQSNYYFERNKTSFEILDMYPRYKTGCYPYNRYYN